MPVVYDSGVGNTNHARVLWQSHFTASRVQFPSVDGRVNVTDPATWSVWSPQEDNPALRFDLGVNRFINSIGIAAHTLGSRGVSVRIQYSNDGSSWTNAMPPFTPSNNDDLLILFVGMSAQHWRILFTGSGFTIGVVQGGYALRFPHPPVDGYTPLHHARKYTKLYNNSIKGHLLGNRVMAAGANTNVDFGFLERDWLEANIGGFEKHYNQGGTFFYAGCPSKYPDDMGYCWAAGADDVLDISFIEADRLASLSFNIESFVSA